MKVDRNTLQVGDNRLSWEDSIIISRDNPIIKSLSKFEIKGLSHQSPFSPRLSPIIFRRKLSFSDDFQDCQNFFALQ